MISVDFVQKHEVVVIVNRIPHTELLEIASEVWSHYSLLGCGKGYHMLAVLADHPDAD